jgi:hypothetical protein
MSASRDALDTLVGILACAIAPAPVTVGDTQANSDVDGVRVSPISLDRVGRSRRHGALMDLQLAAAVTAAGPHALDLIEALLVAIERGPLSAAPLPDTIKAGQLGFVVRLPVTVRIDEPAPPLVTVPPVLQVHPVRSVDGVLLDDAGRAISGAKLTVGGAVSVSGAGGTFHLLVAEGAPTVSVDYGGEQRDLTFDAELEPPRLVWATSAG